MKKKIVIAGVSMMLCLLCGCLESTPLTDTEMDVVADYAATLLLKYDENYTTSLYYADVREVQLTPTPSPTATPVATAKPTPPGTTSNPAGNGSADTRLTPTPTPIPTPTPALYNDVETGKQLTEIIAVENITITCEGYELMDSVVSNEYFSLKAKEGRKYAVVSFKLHNNTDRDMIFDASEKGLEYTLDINTGDVSRVSLSMLENDLQYMPINVPANGEADAVVVFEVKDTVIDTLHLIIENKSDDAVFIKMK